MMTFLCTANHTNVRPALSLRESVLLAEVPENSVRKDIERGCVFTRYNDGSNRHAFVWAEVLVLAGIYRSCLTAELRKRAWKEFEGTFERANILDWTPCSRIYSGDAWEPVLTRARVHLDKFLCVDLSPAFADLRPRVDLYATGLARVEERPGVLGGEAVFKDTRLPVRHIGAMIERGEPLEHILEDYPYLTEGDVEFARLYYLAHPPTGRPRSGAEAADDEKAFVG